MESTETHTRVIWPGEHKNSTRAVATRQPDAYGAWYYIEMWQRPAFGPRYCKIGDRSLKLAFNAAQAAMRTQPS